VAHVLLPVSRMGLLAFPFIPTSASIVLVWFLVFLGFLLNLGTCEDERRGFFALPTYLRLPYCLFAILIFMSALTSLTPLNSFVSLELWATYLVLPLLVISGLHLTGEQAKRWSLDALIIGAVIVSVIGLIQFSRGIETSAAWIDPTAREDIKTRVFSVFDNPNMLSVYLVSVVPLTLDRFISSRRPLWLASFAVILACLGLTFSRAGWASALLGLMIFAVLRDRRLLVVFAVFLILTTVFAPKTGSRARPQHGYISR
jgi:putative inorganic carbon (HCO3(-)) transporter